MTVSELHARLLQCASCHKALPTSLYLSEIVPSLTLSFADFDVDGCWLDNVQHPVHSAKHVAQCDSMGVCLFFFSS